MAGEMIDTQFYAIKVAGDQWVVLKAPIPCAAGDGEIVCIVKEQNLKVTLETVRRDWMADNAALLPA